MKPQRLEELLRSRPPDEPDYRGVLALDGLATDVVRPLPSRPRPRAAATLASTAVALVAISLLAGQLLSNRSAGPLPSGKPSEEPQASGPLGIIPWIDATPAPSPTPEPTPDPASLPVCAAGDLALAAGGWGGATGSLAGGAVVVNISANPCRVGGTPAVDLLDATGAVIAHTTVAEPGTAADSVPLQPGGVAFATIVWSNWCGAPPPRPLGLRLRLPGLTDRLTSEIRVAGPSGSDVTPRCDAPDGGSSFFVPDPFAASEPSSSGYQPEACLPAQLAAFSGAWGAAAGTSYTQLVILNYGGGGGFDCSLAASPVLEIRNAHGKLLAATEPQPGSAATLVISADRAAVARIGFANWCSASPAVPLHLDLLVGSAKVKITSRAEIPVPACMSAPESPPPGFFYDAPLTIPGNPAPPEPDPVDSLPVSVALSPLAATKPGETMHYSVTITNRTPYDKPLNIAFLCPTYTERLFLPDNRTVETHLALNCAPAGWLAGGASVTFAMRLTIPSDSPSGTGTLVWILGHRGAGAKATFRIGP